MRRLSALFFMLALVLSAWMQPATATTGGAPAGIWTGRPPTPTLVDRNPNGSTGDWYLGATPPNADPQLPVLVFVHGLGSTADSWWRPTRYHGSNDMYSFAYNNRYRTAFVQLGGDQSVWANGTLLTELLDEIAQHFGVEQVALVTHSKGGVDANAASVHAGAAPRISRVITLGTPHWGSPLADLAYSTWTWWLAALLGYRNDATFNMQTGYMEYFRSVTDGRDPGVPYYTLSGRGCGPFLSALWLGCLYLPGDDDGLVPVASAREKPGGSHLWEGNWDHDEIRMGSRTWAYFAPVLTGTGPEAQPRQAGGTGESKGTGGSAGRLRPPGNLILRGGEVPGGRLPGRAPGQSFPIESGVEQAVFTVYASSPHFSAILTGPDGRSYRVTVSGRLPRGAIFAGAWTGHLQVPRPARGWWQLSTTAPTRSGYLLVAALDGGVEATLDIGRGVAAPGGQRAVAVGLRPGPVPREMQARVAVSLGGAVPHAQPAFTPVRGGDLRAVVPLPEQPGIHNVTVSLTGTLADGSAFERTLVGSFPAVAPARPGLWPGP